MADTLPFHVQLRSRAGRANPHAIYARMRREQPVYRYISPSTDAPVWLVTRYHDCMSLLRDPRMIRDDRRLTPEQREVNARLIPAESRLNRHLLRLDGEAHLRLRVLVQKGFSHEIVEGMRRRVQEIIDSLLDRVMAAGGMDLIADFAMPLPVTVIAEMLGVSAEDRTRFRAWSQAVVSVPNTPEGLAHKRAVMAEFAEYLERAVAERRTNPGDDLMSALVLAEEQDDRLDTTELLSSIFLLLIAGHETTINLIGNGMLALLQHPDQRQRLIDEPELISSTIEEILRYDCPVETTLLSWSADEIELHGTRIPPGESMLAVLLAANRDPEQFPDPETFDIARTPNQHLAFGFGAHYCLGARLARMEGAMALTTLLRRLPGLRLAVDPGTLTWGVSTVMHGLTSMPVRFS